MEYVVEEWCRDCIGSETIYHRSGDFLSAFLEFMERSSDLYTWCKYGCYVVLKDTDGHYYFKMEMFPSKNDSQQDDVSYGDE